MPSCVHLLPALIELVDQAGAVVMQVYRSEFSVSRKADSSPVTQADRLAETLIVAALAQWTPDIPIVAEEAASAGAVPPIGHRFWLVDPLDGTREFAQRNGEFTVNIALVEAGVPVLGVVGAPAVNQLYAGALGLGVTLRDAAGTRAVRCRSVPEAGVSVLASRSHGDQRALADFLALRRVASIAQAGSSLKLCLIAAGQADLYPRFGRTMEWDIAAGHAVLAAAGGRVVVVADGQPLRYGKPGFENPSFVACGCAPEANQRS